MQPTDNFFQGGYVQSHAICLDSGLHITTEQLLFQRQLHAHDFQGVCMKFKTPIFQSIGNINFLCRSGHIMQFLEKTFFYFDSQPIHMICGEWLA